MIRIDAHHHFWQYNPTRHGWITDEMAVIRKDFQPADLKIHLDEHGISGAVTVQVDQTEAETMKLIDLAEQFEFIKGVVGWVDFRDATIHERLEYFSQRKKLKGFRHIVQAEPDLNFLLQEKFITGVKALQAYNMTYDVLVYHTHLPVVIKFLDRLPDQKFVIDHIGKPAIAKNDISDWKQRMRVISAHQNVYCKVSGMVTEANWQCWTEEDIKPYLDVVFDCFSIDRVMYGSDWPVCLVAATYRRQIEMLEHYMSSFSKADQEKFWGSNAIQFYNL